MKHYIFVEKQLTCKFCKPLFKQNVDLVNEVWILILEPLTIVLVHIYLTATCRLVCFSILSLTEFDVNSVVVFLLCATGITLTLNSVQYTNNSVVTITDIGTGSAALLCTTANLGCCSSANQETQWYFPNGTQLIPQPSMTFSRTRSLSPAAVHLNRNPEATTTGIFHCDILDARGDLQSLYVGIYTATTGELCMFIEENHITAK